MDVSWSVNVEYRNTSVVRVMTPGVSYASTPVKKPRAATDKSINWHIEPRDGYTPCNMNENPGVHQQA